MRELPEVLTAMRRNKSLVEPVTVLLIQADRSAGEMYRLKLEIDGYRVTLVDSVDEARQRVAQVRPDIFFLDVRTRGMNDYSLLERFRADPHTSGLPAVILKLQPERDHGTRPEARPAGLRHQIGLAKHSLVHALGSCCHILPGIGGEHRIAQLPCARYLFTAVAENYGQCLHQRILVAVAKDPVTRAILTQDLKVRGNVACDDRGAV